MWEHQSCPRPVPRYALILKLCWDQDQYLILRSQVLIFNINTKSRAEQPILRVHKSCLRLRPILALNLIFYLTILRNVMHTVMQNINKETKYTHTRSGLPGGLDKKTFTLKPTNHRRGHKPEDLKKKDWMYVLIISWGWSGVLKRVYQKYVYIFCFHRYIY